MTHEDVQLDAIVQSGRISKADARRLRDAMDGRSRWQVLLDPLDTLSPRAAWTVSALVVLLSLGLAQLGIRFDGALDLHGAGPRVSWAWSLFDQVNALGVTALVLWVASLIASRRGRLVDTLQAVMIARVPLLVSGVVLVLARPYTSKMIANPGPDASLAILLMTLVSLPFFVWFVVLLYRGLATSAGIRGARAAVVFTIGIIVAEVITKYLIVLAYTVIS